MPGLGTGGGGQERCGVALAHLARDSRTSRPSERRTTRVSPDTISMTRPAMAAPADADGAFGTSIVAHIPFRSSCSDALVGPRVWRRCER